MDKKMFLGFLGIGMIIILYFLIINTKDFGGKITNDSITKETLQKRFCETLAKQYGDCKRVVELDRDLNVFFAEGEIGIIPVLTNKDFTKMIKTMNVVSYQEFKEEKGDRLPYGWQVHNNIAKDVSMISGLASSDVKKMVINSEGNITPNIIPVQDNVSFWYVVLKKDKVHVPVKITVYDKEDKIIYGGNEEE